ncbi:MAG: hypothetical protein D6786_09135 [Gammaproteobacteria bacterium]|nr:MAG: hypothetical protein D6786_09135 [Gammaproteobacteria bacterium]
MSDFKKKSLATAIGTTFVIGLAGQAVAEGGNPFSMTELDSGYMVADKGAKAEGKCGTNSKAAAAKKKADGKCGTGKCGANKARAKAKAAKEADGNCGGNKAGQVAKEGTEGNCGGKAGEKASEKAGEMKKEMEGACGAGA